MSEQGPHADADDLGDLEPDEFDLLDDESATPPWVWLDLPDGEYAALRREFAAWVAWLEDAYGAWVRLPPCWPLHEEQITYHEQPADQRGEQHEGFLAQAIQHRRQPGWLVEGGRA